MLDIRPGAVAVVGAGGKTTLVRALAEELAGCVLPAGAVAAGADAAVEGTAAAGEDTAVGNTLAVSAAVAGEAGRANAADETARPARVIVATSTKMFVPDWCPVLLDASLDEVRAALAAEPVVCVGSIHEPTGKLAAPVLAFSELAEVADYVLVEADGAKMLPLKAHDAHEPVVPACASRVVCVVGIDGVGKPVSQVCHRAEAFARLAEVSPDAPVTPEAIAAVLNAEALHDVVLVNKVHTADDWRAAERIAALLRTPVVAGSLREEEFRCLQ